VKANSELLHNAAAAIVVQVKCSTVTPDGRSEKDVEVRPEPIGTFGSTLIMLPFRMMSRAENRHTTRLFCLVELYIMKALSAEITA